MTSRRSALQLGAAAMAAAPLAAFVTPAVAEDGMFSVPPLPYAYVSSHQRCELAPRQAGAAELPHTTTAGRTRAAHRRRDDEVSPRLPPPGVRQQPQQGDSRPDSSPGVLLLTGMPVLDISAGHGRQGRREPRVSDAWC